MIRHQFRPPPVEKEEPGEREAIDGSEDSCRCKEVSKKRPIELLKVMLGDLAFWKKAKRHK